MDALLQSRYNGLSTVQIQMVQPSILKRHKFKNDWNPFLYPATL